MITVRYFAAAAEAAGVKIEQLAANSLGEAKHQMIAQHGEQFGQILGRCALLVDGIRVDESTATIPDGATLDVLPPFAGG